MLEDALAEQLVGVVSDADGVAEAQLLQSGLFFHLAKGALLDGLFRLLLSFGEVPEFVPVDEQVFPFLVLYQAAGGGDFLEVGAEFRIIGITDGDALALEVNVPHYFRIFAELALAKIVFPAEFINEMRDSLGLARAERVLAALVEEPAVSVRVNPYKLTVEALRAHFGDLAGDAVAWAPEEGFYLKERPSFTLDPLFHAGAYYVQEASSMYVGGLFDQAVAALGSGGVSVSASERVAGLRVLDLCAAPGGKTTQLLSHLDGASLLVANEVVPARATVLAENVARWGCANVAVTSSDPSAFTPLRNFFDVVVVDAPCSGEGMFRKDERAVAEWSPDNVRLCAARQRRILADVWPALAPGGFLIYSTCTFNRFEDEDNVDWICRELGATCQEMRHFYPGEDRGEGFFAALLRKDGPQNETGPKLTAVGPPNLTVPVSTIGPQNERTGSQRHSVSRKQRFQPDSGTQNGCVILEAHSVALLKQVSVSLAAVLPQLEKQLRVIASGVAVATRKGRDLVPEADFALAVNRMSLDGLSNRTPLDGQSERTSLNGLSYEVVEISREDALKFLSKDSLVLPDAPRGYLLLTHAGLGLGFVKNLGTRTNSLLPSSRRIRQRP